MKHRVYLSAKMQLSEVKEWLKSSNDKPLIRQSLNDTCDRLEREIRAEFSLSDAMQELYCYWLQNYCVKLHP